MDKIRIMTKIKFLTLGLFLLVAACSPKVYQYSQMTYDGYGEDIVSFAVRHNDYVVTYFDETPMQTLEIYELRVHRSKYILLWNDSIVETGKVEKIESTE